MNRDSGDLTSSMKCTSFLLVRLGSLALCGLASLSAMLHSGCATGSSSYPAVTLPVPPSQEVRGQLGAISVRGIELKAAEFAQPIGKGRAAAKGGVGGLVAPVAGGAVAGPYGVAAGVILAPVTGTAGAIYGAFAGMTEDEFMRIRTTLQSVARETNVMAQLERGIADAIRSLPPECTITVANTAAETAPTLLEVTPAMLRLDGGPQAVNPPLTIIFVVRVRLVRVADGAELYSGDFAYHGPRHSLRAWSSDGGARFREAIKALCDALPAQIVENLFLISPLPASPSQTRSAPGSANK
jgi:hypothetical protein